VIAPSDDWRDAFADIVAAQLIEIERELRVAFVGIRAKHSWDDQYHAVIDIEFVPEMTDALLERLREEANEPDV
jgi:hypothetical protein